MQLEEKSKLVRKLTVQLYSIMSKITAEECYDRTRYDYKVRG